MAPEQVTASSSELTDLIKRATEQAVSELSARLPRMYKFPEDIVLILGGYVPVGTIRHWKTAGYLHTTPVGARSYVTEEQWQWFIDNHKALMSRAKRNRGAVFGGRG